MQNTQSEPRTIPMPQMSAEDAAHIQGLQGTAGWDPHKVVRHVVGQVEIQRLDQHCLVCDEVALETRTARVWVGPQSQLRVGPSLQPLTHTCVESHTVCTHCGVNPERISPKTLALLGQT